MQSEVNGQFIIGKHFLHIQRSVQIQKKEERCKVESYTYKTWPIVCGRTLHLYVVVELYIEKCFRDSAVDRSRDSRGGRGGRGSKGVS